MLRLLTHLNKKEITTQQMDERSEKGLCFNCDSKFSKGDKCGEKKLFYIYYEEEEANEQEPFQVEEIEETIPKEINPMIYWHALARVSTPHVKLLELIITSDILLTFHIDMTIT